MSKFNGVSSFRIWEDNWLRWLSGKGYLNHLYRLGCPTGKLIAALKQDQFTIDSDAPLPVFAEYGYKYEQIVNWLPSRYKQVYLASTINKFEVDGKWKFSRVHSDDQRIVMLKITEHAYKTRLDSAIEMIKHKGGLE